MSFSSPRVRKLLTDSFYCTLTNIAGSPSAGLSLKHAPHDPPGPNARGVGRQNVQTLFTTPEGKIYHVASGFLSSEDFLKEAAFALLLYERQRKQPDKAQLLVQSAHRKRLQRISRQSVRRSPFTSLTTTRDLQFLIRHPLLSREEFERNPRLLVGDAATVYGSGIATGSPGARGLQATSSDTKSGRQVRRAVTRGK